MDRGIYSTIEGRMDSDHLLITARIRGGGKKEKKKKMKKGRIG